MTSPTPMSGAGEPPEPPGELELDLDEDLFNFDELMPERGERDSEHDIDVEGIFAAFEEAEVELDEPLPDPPGAAVLPPPAAPLPTALVEDLPAALSKPRAAKSAPVEPPRVVAATADASASAPLPPAPSLLDSVPGLAPSPDEQAPARRARPPLARSVIVILIAMTLLNVSVGFLTLGSAAGMQRKVDDAALRISETAVELRADLAQEAEAAAAKVLPRVPPAAEKHAALDRAAADIDAGSYARARERIYALLAIAGRLPEETRADVEARASFLLARSYHAQAVSAEKAP